MSAPPVRVECAQCDREGIPQEQRELHHLRERAGFCELLLREYRAGHYGEKAQPSQREADLEIRVGKLQEELNEARTLIYARDARIAQIKEALATTRDWIVLSAPDDAPGKHAAAALATAALPGMRLLKKGDAS